ncbi:tyrosine phosphatase family protein [Rhizobium sp. 2YAF20]|jgi:predicted protein tyrosine phosphatase|uniref:tyrosine phosphatase family protein n=1 Tax=Rhizobium sp. 2YAF20 TaxID=3233027 RepID=UPI003F972E68
MQTLEIPSQVICGLEELGGHSKSGVTHVLSLVDPDLPEIEDFEHYGSVHRIVLRLHDIIDPQPGLILPNPSHVETILDFGAAIDSEAPSRLLVHCHMGVSRSTAAMTAIMAQAQPDKDEDFIFETLRAIRPQAWPNSLMIQFADDQLEREGRLVAALRRHYGTQVRTDATLSDWMTRLGRGREVAMAL